MGQTQAWICIDALCYSVALSKVNTIIKISLIIQPEQAQVKPNLNTSFVIKKHKNNNLLSIRSYKCNSNAVSYFRVSVDDGALPTFPI